MIKNKVISTESENMFEKELNSMYNDPKIEIVNVQYNSTTFFPMESEGWITSIFYTALVTYRIK